MQGQVQQEVKYFALFQLYTVHTARRCPGDAVVWRGLIPFNKEFSTPPCV